MKLTSQLAIRSGRAGRRLRRRLGDFIADRRGFSAMTFAISAIPMFGLVGLAVDVGTAYHMKAQVQQAADTVATQLARRSMNDGSLNSQQLLERGKLMMSNNLDFAISYNKFDVKLTDKEVEITAQAQFNTNFSKMVGISKLDISASAKARYQIEEADIFVLIDNTASMLIGATVRVADQMLSEVGCEFACHTGGTLATGDSYYRALSRGYYLKYNAVMDAIKTLADRITKNDPKRIHYRVGLYSFDEGANWISYKNHVPLTSDMSQLKSRAALIKPVVPYNRHTDFVVALAGMKTEMRAKKWGNRKQILLVITDGLHDSNRYVPGSTWFHGYVGPVPQSECSGIKSDGVALAVLETPYYSPTYSWMSWYRYVVPQLAGALKSCASPGLYGQVDFNNVNSYSNEMDKLVGNATMYGPRLVRNNPAGTNND